MFLLCLCIELLVFDGNDVIALNRVFVSMQCVFRTHMIENLC